METCIVPVLIYGCVNWILTERVLELLEACFGELEKKGTKSKLTNKNHSSTPAGYTALEMESVGIGMLAGMLVCKRVCGKNHFDS